MKEEDKIIEKSGRDHGFRVPEGYFDRMHSEVMSKLPPYPEVKQPKRTPWQMLKPYAALAAMFAGIWLMMQVFHHASTPAELSLDNPPEMLALAVNSPEWEDIYTLQSDLSDIDLAQEVGEQYESIQDFEKDFGYQLEPTH